MSKRIKSLVSIAVCLLLLIAIFFGSSCSCRNDKEDDENKTPAIEEVTITYQTNGGDALAPTKIEKGSSITLPIPSYTDKTFRGWYYDVEFGDKTAESITVSSDITLYARWGVYLSFSTSADAASIDKKLVDLNETIEDLPTSLLDGYISTGWYYDEECLYPVYDFDTIDENTTLYAGYSKTSVGSLIKTQRLEILSINPQIVVTSSVIITNDNVNTYFEATNFAGESLELICEASDNSNEYIISFFDTLSPGERYFIDKQITSTTFISADGVDVDNDTTQISLSVYQENFENIVLNPMTHVNNTFVVEWEEDKYTYSSSDDDNEKSVDGLTILDEDFSFKVGDLVSIGEGTEYKTGDYIYKVVSAEKRLMEYSIALGEEAQTDYFWFLECVEPNFDDVYAEYNVYVTGDVQLEGVISITEQQIIDSLYASEGYEYLKTTVTNSIQLAPTVLSYVNTLSDTDKALVATSLSAFEFDRPEVSFSIDGNVLSFSIKLAGKIVVQNHFEIAVSLMISNATTVKHYSDVTPGISSINPLEWLYVETIVDFSNEFSIEIGAEVSFVSSAINPGQSATTNVTDISKELKYIYESSRDQLDVIEDSIFNTGLFDVDNKDLNYVEVFRIPLGKIPIPITSIVSLEIEFSVTGQVGARAGLFVGFTHSYTES